MMQGRKAYMMTKLIFEKSQQDVGGIYLTDEVVDFSFLNKDILTERKNLTTRY